MVPRWRSGTCRLELIVQPQTATVYNIGNLDLTLSSPYYSPSLAGFPFHVLGSSTCANNLVLRPSIPCTINVQFAPIANIHSTQQLKVNSDGYNSGIPTLNLSGTGVLKGSEKHRRGRSIRPERRSTRSGGFVLGKMMGTQTIAVRPAILMQMLADAPTVPTQLGKVSQLDRSGEIML